MGIPRSIWKLLFASLAYGGIATFVFWFFAPRWGFAPAQVGKVGNVWWLALLAAFFVKLKWLHVAWTAIPERCRVTARGEWISPDEAAYKHLKPMSAVFWQFHAHVGLAEATNAVLASYDTRARASTRLAFLACATLFIPIVNLVVFPALLFVHMLDVDDAHAEMQRGLAANAHVRPYAAPSPPTLLSSAKPFAFAALLTWLPLPWVFLAIFPYTKPPPAVVKPPPPPPAHVEGDLDALATDIASCAERRNAQMIDNLSECPGADAKLRELNATQRDAVIVFATPSLKAYSPTYGREYGQRRIACKGGTCVVERL